MSLQSLRDALDVMTHEEVNQWLRDRGVIVLDPAMRPKSVLVLVALDWQSELNSGGVRRSCPDRL
jgi:hypothetical protein